MVSLQLSLRNILLNLLLYSLHSETNGIEHVTFPACWEYISIGPDFEKSGKASTRSNYCPSTHLHLFGNVLEAHANLIGFSHRTAYINTCSGYFDSLGQPPVY